MRRRRTMKRIGSFLFCAFVVFLLGCDGSSDNQQKPESNAPQLETGRFALQKMLAPAHLWAGDTQPIRMKSNAGKDNLGHDGKSSFWLTTFASAARQKTENFSWSGTPPRGVDHGSEDTFNPGNRSTQPFDLNFLKVDGDKAYQVAQE